MAEPDEPQEKPRHEPSDINVKAVLAVAGGLIAAGALIHLGLWWLLEVYAGIYGNPQRPILTERELPPEPRLQVSSTREWAAMKADSERVLNSYAWTDPGQGMVRIPIERAMELLAAQGFPTKAMPETGRDRRNLPVLTESGYAID